MNSPGIYGKEYVFTHMDFYKSILDMSMWYISRKEPFTVHIWHALRNIHADVFVQTGHHTSTNFVNKSSLVDKIQKTKKVTFRYLDAIIFQISVFILSYMPILTSIFSALKPRTICVEDIISCGQDIINYSISQTA